MKKLTIQILTLIAVVVALSSCTKDSNTILDELQGNEYLIEVDGEVYEEGKSLFSGIASDLSDENTMQAGAGATLAIYFKRDNYNAGEVLEVGYDESIHSAIAAGALVLNKDTGNEEIVMYGALSGTATIVSKKRIEFNLNCYSLGDITDDGGPAQGATPYIITGYVTEQSPQ